MSDAMDSPGDYYISPVFEYRLRGIDQWLVLVGRVSTDIGHARYWLAQRFGDRVQAVRLYRCRRGSA